MGPHSLAFLAKDSNFKGSLAGPTGISTKATSKIIKWRGSANLLGAMADAIKDIGKII